LSEFRINRDVNLNQPRQVILNVKLNLIHYAEPTAKVVSIIEDNDDENRPGQNQAFKTAAQMGRG